MTPHLNYFDLHLEVNCSHYRHRKAYFVASTAHSPTRIKQVSISAVERSGRSDITHSFFWCATPDCQVGIGVGFHVSVNIVLRWVILRCCIGSTTIQQTFALGGVQTQLTITSYILLSFGLVQSHIINLHLTRKDKLVPVNPSET